jgi:hypothetical protein
MTNKNRSTAFSATTKILTAIAGAALATTVLLSSCDVWGTVDNPVDPKSPNYQGYTVSDAKDIKPLSPANEAASVDAPVLESCIVADATEYRFQVWTDAATPAIVVSGKSPTPRFSPAVNGEPALWTSPDSGNYMWRVMAVTSKGEGAWSSEYAHFRIGDIIAP